MTALIDGRVRTRAVEGIEVSMTLAAGAGSGKTTVLSQRVVALLVGGTAPGRVAAITFTEKAAGELQARVRGALEKRLSGGANPVLEGALRGLPAMTLTTIHSFCKQLLNAEALDAAWAPGSQVGGGGGGVVDAVWGAWRRGFDARMGPQTSLLVWRVVKDGTLKAAALRMLSRRDLKPAVGVPFSEVNALASFAPLADEVRAAAAECKAPERCKLYNNNRDFLAQLEGVVDLDKLMPFLLYDNAGSKQGGKAGDYPAGGKARFSAAIQAVRDWRGEALSGLHATLVLDLQAHFVEAVLRARAEAAVVSFDDLLFRAADLLRGDSAVRARLAGRFDALLIDEVQDTDPIQAEVAALLTRDASAEGDWRAHAPQPGRLFAVGDPKQSIYRFRGADVATWGALRALVEADGEALELTQNFRSVPGIVEWVNRTFGDMPGYTAQVPFRADATLDPVVCLPVADHKAPEHEAVVAHLLKLKAEGAQVVDRDAGHLRPLRWGDVMVLLPGWTAAEDIQAAFAAAGVPAMVEGGNAFTDRDEVRLAIAALRAIEEPADAMSIVFVLRGLFGVDYPTLAAHKVGGGRWSYLAHGAPSGPVADAFAVLRDLHYDRGGQSMVAGLDVLLNHTHVQGVWALLADGGARLANLDKVRAKVRELEVTSLVAAEVLDQLRAMADDKEGDLSRADVDHDTVLITSYFKAKGLEAPVVVLCRATRKAPIVDMVVDRAAGSVAIKFGPLEPPDWAALKVEEKAAQEAERKRWLYVACTRPRDQLVITRPLTAASRVSDLRDHLGGGLDDPGVTIYEDLPPPPWQTQTFPGLDAQVDALLAAPPRVTDEDARTWTDARRALTAGARKASTRWRSMQEVAHRRRVVMGYGMGRVAGTVLHEVMERLDLSKPHAALCAEVPALLKARAARSGIDDDALAPIEAALLAILEHPVIERARQAPERWHEVPFGFERGRTQISGTIDLCFPTDEHRARWVVVDWKSDLPPVGTPARANYEDQISLYARAVLATVGPKVEVETVLVGPHLLPAIEPAGDPLLDVDAALATALRPVLDLSCGAPEVGYEGVSEVPLEVAWPALKVGLLLVGGVPDGPEIAADLRAAGWRVVEADDDVPGWAPAAVAALRASLR